MPNLASGSNRTITIPFFIHKLRERNEAQLGIAAGDELVGLGNAGAFDDLRLDRLVEAESFQVSIPARP